MGNGVQRLEDLFRLEFKSTDVRVRRPRRGDWRRVHLSPTEYGLFRSLLTNPGKPMSLADLNEEAFDGRAIRLASLARYVENLRRKLGSAGAAIRKLYGRGYVLALPKRTDAPVQRKRYCRSFSIALPLTQTRRRRTS